MEPSAKTHPPSTAWTMSILTKNLTSTVVNEENNNNNSNDDNNTKTTTTTATPPATATNTGTLTLPDTTATATATSTAETTTTTTTAAAATVATTPTTPTTTTTATITARIPIPTSTAGTTQPAQQQQHTISPPPSTAWTMSIMNELATKRSVPPPIPTAAKPPVHHKHHPSKPLPPLPPGHRSPDDPTKPPLPTQTQIQTPPATPTSTTATTKTKTTTTTISSSSPSSSSPLQLPSDALHHSHQNQNQLQSQSPQSPTVMPSDPETSPPQQQQQQPQHERSRASSFKKTFRKAFSIKHKASDAGSPPPLASPAAGSSPSSSSSSFCSCSSALGGQASPLLIPGNRNSNNNCNYTQHDTDDISPATPRDRSNSSGMVRSTSSSSLTTTTTSTPSLPVPPLGADVYEEETPLICHFLSSFVSKIEFFNQKGAKKAAHRGKVAKSVEEFFEGIPPACRDAAGGTAINWARAFHRRMLFTKRFLSCETVEAIGAALAAYSEYAEDPARRGGAAPPNALFVGFQDYFRTHAVDIENSLLGVHASKTLCAKCLQHAPPLDGPRPGTLVAVRARGATPTADGGNDVVTLAFSGYVFARIAGKDGTSVAVTTDPCEKAALVVVPPANVLYLSEDQERRINSRCRVEEVVAVPLQNIINEFTPIVNRRIAEDITEFLDDKHFFYADTARILNPAETLTFDSMPMLEALVGWFKQSLSDDSFCDSLISSLDPKWKTLKQDLIVKNTVTCIHTQPQPQPKQPNPNNNDT